MRRPLVVLAMVLGCSGLAASARAQTAANPFAGGFLSNPVSAYQGYYIPSAVAAASTPLSVGAINQQALVRQQATAIDANGDRAGLYDEFQPIGLEDLNPNAPLGRQRSLARRAMTAGGRRSATGSSNTNLAGSGPPQYFNRASAYYPTLPSGRGLRRSITPTVGQRRVGAYTPGRGGRGMGMGGGMGMR